MERFAPCASSSPYERARMSRCPYRRQAAVRTQRWATFRPTATVWRLLLIGLGAATASGCTGRASLHLLPLGHKRISTTKPLVVRITPDQCYFWVNEDRKLCVAMREWRGSFWGKPLEKEFNLSLVLDGLPSGSARDYRVTRRTARTRNRAGYSHLRAASLNGIVAVWGYGKGNLHGRFRMTAKQQSYSVLVGWGGDHHVLIVGEFTATRNQRAGKAILSRTEEGTMSRPPPRPKPTPVSGPSRKPITQPPTNTGQTRFPRLEGTS